MIFKSLPSKYTQEKQNIRFKKMRKTRGFCQFWNIKEDTRAFARQVKVWKRSGVCKLFCMWQKNTQINPKIAKEWAPNRAQNGSKTLSERIWKLIQVKTRKFQILISFIELGIEQNWDSRILYGEENSEGTQCLHTPDDPQRGRRIIL